jgi:transposase
MATLFGLYPFLLKLYADGGYQGPPFQEGLRRVCRRVRVEIVKRSDQAKGFAVLPKRWIVLRCTIVPSSVSSGQPWSVASI